MGQLVRLAEEVLGRACVTGVVEFQMKFFFRISVIVISKAYTTDSTNVPATAVAADDKEELIMHSMPKAGCFGPLGEPVRAA